MFTRNLTNYMFVQSFIYSLCSLMVWIISESFADRSIPTCMILNMSNLPGLGPWLSLTTNLIPTWWHWCCSWHEKSYTTIWAHSISRELVCWYSIIDEGLSICQYSFNYQATQFVTPMASQIDSSFVYYCDFLFYVCDDLLWFGSWIHFNFPPCIVLAIVIDQKWNVVIFLMYPILVVRLFCLWVSGYYARVFSIKISYPLLSYGSSLAGNGLRI